MGIENNAYVSYVYVFVCVYGCTNLATIEDWNEK